MKKKQITQLKMRERKRQMAFGKSKMKSRVLCVVLLLAKRSSMNYINKKNNYKTIYPPTPQAQSFHSHIY
jgi:hypothetical protein